MEQESICRVRREVFWCWIRVIIFSIAFAWVESSVVVYLREIYFNGAFNFPLVINWVDGRQAYDPLMGIELGREAATIIMLGAMGCIAGKNRLQRFSFFIISFGIWDIFYYVWLKVMVNWPENLMTWDILFLLPLPWVGPVITPVLIALAMFIAGSLIIFYDETGIAIKTRWFDWVIEFLCGLLLIVAFCWDWKNIMQVQDGTGHSGIPNPFAWWLYMPSLLASVIYLAVRARQIIMADPGTDS